MNVVTRLPERTNEQKSQNLLDLTAARVWVVLPAYNEAVGLPALLKKIHVALAGRDQDYEVIVVDDGSQDDTARIASQASFQIPLKLVQHPQNQGLSGALRTGLAQAIELGKSGDVIVTLDADDTQQPATIDRMLLLIAEGYDVVVASRYQAKSRVVGVPPSRILMAWFARLLFRGILPIRGIRDYTCGFRAYRYDVLKQTSDYYGEEFVSEQGFSCMVDVLLKMRRFHFVMGEVPMLLRYDRKHGPSKMDVGRTSLKTIRLLLKRRFGR